MGIRIDGTSDLINAADGSLTVEGLSINVSGVVTASDGFKVGSAATIYSNGNATFAGIVTASNTTISSTGIGIGAATNGSANYPSVTISGNSGGAVHFEDDGDLLADIYGSSDGLTLSTRKTSDAITFQLNSGSVGEKARFDSNGRLLIGVTSADTDMGSNLQVAGSSYAASGILQARTTADGNGPALDFIKSRNTTWGSHTIVQDGDELGRIYFRGDDGVNYSGAAAAIFGEIDGTPGANDLPGRLLFYTSADGADSPTERLRITAAGDFGTGGVTPTTQSGRVFHLHAGAAQQRFHMTNNTTGVSATDGFEIIVEEGVNTRIRNFEAGALMFDTGGTDNEAFRIDSSGRLLVNHTSSHTDLHGKIQLAGAASQSIDIARYTANAHPPYLNLFKSRNATTGGNTIVQDDDTVGYINGYGNDGSGFHSCAGIAFRIDGTPGNDDMPGRIDFETVADGGTTLTNRMSILNTGTVQIMSELLSMGASTNTGGASSANFGIEYPGNTKNAIKTRNTHAGDGNAAVFITGSTEVGSIVQGTSNTAYNTSSDYRLKENQVEISDGITRLKTLKPYRFNWKIDPTTTVDGFFAHEVTAVPEAIKGTKDAVASEDIDSLNIKKDDPIYQQIDHSKLVPLLTAALQEEIGKREALEARVAALESA